MSGVHLRRRVTKTGQVRWMCVYRVGGRYGRIRSAGTFPTRQLARARADQVGYAIAVGVDPETWLRDPEPEPILIPSATFPATGERESVYAVQADTLGLVKIGYTRNPRQRLQILTAQNAAPLRLVSIFPGTRADEDDLHRAFAEDRSHGEWFHVTDRIADVLHARCDCEDCK